MAKVTKKQILEATEDVEQIYTEMEDELLINIARHLNTGTDFNLAELVGKIGNITDENIKIIAKHSSKSEAEIKKLMEQISKTALKDVNEEFKKAEKEGKIKPPKADNEKVEATIEGFTVNTLDKLKSMNNTILASSIEQYQTAVMEIAQEKQKIASQRLDREVKYEQMADAAQDIFIEGQATLKAAEKAINRLNEEGITGFIDRAGRHWNADTYSTMVARTNAHSLAIESVKARQEEYGSDLFQISAHNGARELCYPYQGKIYSWSAAKGGSFVDGAGVKWQYGSLENDTSYGEPAGIFGINCGHYPMPIVPGISIVHEQPIQPKEENDKEYIESQKQRYLERQIRDAKRQYEMQKAAGADEETLKQYKEKINEKQKIMRDFTDETGRKRRYDREKLFFEDSGNYKPTMSVIKNAEKQEIYEKQAIQETNETIKR